LWPVPADQPLGRLFIFLIGLTVLTLATAVGVEARRRSISASALILAAVPLTLRCGAWHFAGWTTALLFSLGSVIGDTAGVLRWRAMGRFRLHRIKP